MNACERGGEMVGRGRILHLPGVGARARCRYCRELVPIVQVPFGQERRTSSGRLTATMATIPHSRGLS